MTRLLCIYHGNCQDGFGARWAVHQKFGQRTPVEYHQGQYGEPPPDVAGKTVLICDFSYPRAQLIEMAGRAESALVIDHHQTAAEDLAGFPRPGDHWDNWSSDRGFRVDAPEGAPEGMPANLAAIFDMNQSGAGLTWNFLHGAFNRPAIIDHIEDRDLWQLRLPHTKAISATLFSYPYSEPVWDDFAARLGTASGREQIIAEGNAIVRKAAQDLDNLLPMMTREMVIGGVLVWVANLPLTMATEAGYRLCQGRPFAACYWDQREFRTFSLRGAGQHNVDHVAKLYGGGGHKDAAGFRVPFDKLASLGLL